MRSSFHDKHDNDEVHHYHFIEAPHHHHEYYNLPKINITRDIYYNIKTDWTITPITLDTVIQTAAQIAAAAIQILTGA